jgi:hypothetical protein
MDLVAAWTMDAPVVINPYHNEMTKMDVKTDHKLPFALTVEEYSILLLKERGILELNLVFIQTL